MANTSTMKKLVLLVKLTVLFLVVLECPVRSATNIVSNGGFEQGGTGWGWTYNFGVSSGFPSAAEGRNWGEVYGTIYQDLSTLPEQLYHLHFALAGNFNITNLAVVNVLWDGASLGSVSWNPAGHNINNLGWLAVDIDAIAGDSSTRLTFSDPYIGDGSGRIDRIDAISVMAVPEPSSLALVGLIGLAVFKNRRSCS